jgi:hypothetical protein
MDQKSFLILNSVAMVAIAYYFLKGRKRPPPSQLNLGSKGVNQESIRLAKTSQAPKSGGSRVLNVMFNFNGHAWEAFETLGIPGGSSVTQAEEAFVKIVAKVGSDEPFLRAALEAIRKAYAA